MRRLYSLVICCVVPFAFAMVWWRGLRDRSYRQGLRERFGWGRPTAGSSIWLHAVSLGEMSAAAPLIQSIMAAHASTPLVLTTATPAGRARAQALFGEAAHIRFLPYDTPGAVRRFLARTRPRLGIVMETELWPNLFHQCERRAIPMILVNARLSARSVARYRRFGALFSRIFAGDVLVAAQSAADAERFKAIGADPSKIRVIGNVKFDLQPDERSIQQGRVLRALCGAERAVWIAGSTHAGEEEMILDAHEFLRQQRPNALLLLVPRHRERFAEVAELLAGRGIRFARRSAGEPVSDAVQVLLADTVGELPALYAACDVAFVGGSLVPIGGHNLLEPAALGLPVLTGPSHFNGKEIAELLLQNGAATELANPRGLAEALQRLFDSPDERQRMGSRGASLVSANRGSTQRLAELIEALLARDPATGLSAAAPR